MNTNDFYNIILDFIYDTDPSIEININHVVQFLNTINRQITTLTKEQFSKFQIKLYKKNENNEICIICLDDFKNRQHLIELDCKHYFHKNCIKNWLLKQSSKCPICRNDSKV